MTATEPKLLLQFYVHIPLRLRRHFTRRFSSQRGRQGLQATAADRVLYTLMR